jgi:ABC-type lipoprotein export system ATPase subunit
MLPSIVLEQVMPAPLEGLVSSQSQVWNTHLQLDPGQAVRVSAVSGKGKSTLISIIYGLRKDYSGKVILNGQNIRSFTQEDWANYRQRCFSIVFQDLRLFLSYTGWENIQVRTALFGKPDRKKTEEMADTLGVLPLLNKKCGQLSYGERQRVAIIRALAAPFQWLLLDEPFSHLDQGNMEKASRLIAEKCREYQAGMILTSLDGGEHFNYQQNILL